MGSEDTEPEVPVDAVGRRVFCGGERATVRYVGPVPPTSGLWLGVEWDNPERGKHDGSHSGVQYFTCSHPKGGSFVRPAKATFGVDLLTAVQQEYLINPEKVLSEDISVSCKKVNWKGVTERSFQDLPSVVLNSSEVNGPGAAGDIRKTLPNIRWLDLSGTLLSSWEDVAAITEQLDKLEGLQLHRNRLTLPSEPSVHTQAFCNLKLLALNQCRLTWPQILECAIMWPQVEELFLEENNITELQRPETVLQTLKSLSLVNNPLVEDSLLSLSALPRLENLNLSGTGISVIRFEDAAPGEQTVMFPALSILNLTNNNISEWFVVDELAKLSSLVKLSCKGNRLVSSDRNLKTARQMVIAKLAQLDILDNCSITSEERRGAELDYIKMFGEEWLKAGGPEYGAPEESELKKPQPSTLKNQLIKITFVFPSDPDRKPIEKKLPASMDVLKVKGLLYRTLKVPAADLQLSYKTPKKPEVEFEINNDQKTLQFFSVEDGDQLQIHGNASTHRLPWTSGQRHRNPPSRGRHR
ncbi:Tubulin-specific chaperone E [Oryzias melastigma]|uniref:Tubulin-specific chaperone E n=1 Tax=Oryzias melastigma TaxID=30732 RepID=A0A834F0R1_ORYME|nr:Tubulin-specific chaperone E [Oryzias melastigma]